MIETRKNEVRYSTLEPRKLLNMYIMKRVCKTWHEDFIDEDTNETVSIERNEVLFERGTLIDQDMLAKIRFSIEAGEITKEIEVSNQKRIGYELENRFLYPYIAQAQISDKKHKFLFYASSIDTALLILKDYIELNYNFGFTIKMVKEFDSCIILTDSLKERKVDEQLSFIDEDTNESSDMEEEQKPEEKKFYQIETKIKYGEDQEITYTFVVHTYNVERAMMLITAYLKDKEDRYYEEAMQKGNEYEKRDIHATIEVAKPIPVGRFIPKEFSMAYVGIKE